MRWPSPLCGPGTKEFRHSTEVALHDVHAEHAPVEIDDAATSLKVGDKVEIAVHYHDGTVHLHDRMYGIRNGKVEKVFTIEQGD